MIVLCIVVFTYFIFNIMFIVNVFMLGIEKKKSMIVNAFISVHASAKQGKIHQASVLTKRLSITYEVNKKIVDFFDVRFNLNDQTYEPYRKPNNDPVYINKHYNHPPNIINEVPKAI